MIRELINFTANLDEEFKNLGSVPKEGLHVRVKIVTDESGSASIDVINFEYELYSKKQRKEVSGYLTQCKILHQNAWCIDTNKCFDLPIKAIHTCSPFAVAFKREHLEGGAKYKENIGKKKQIYERFDDYFNKAFSLFENREDSEKYVLFKHFFTHNTFTSILRKIESESMNVRTGLEQELVSFKEAFKEASDKMQKEIIKGQIADIEQQLLKVKPLEDSDYVIFYLDIPLGLYKQAHKKYLDDKLFNTANYNTVQDKDGFIYGTSNFMNGFNSNMPFLMHQTAPFDINGRISNIDAKLLNELKNIFPNKTLPNPLPIFIYKKELQGKVIAIFRESEFRFGHKEIIQELTEKNIDDISNYYLLFWQNTMDGIVFKDYDFVSRFEYKLSNPIAILNLFDIKEKGGKELKYYPLISNIFEFEQQVLKPFIQSKYLRVDYFGELNKDDYAKLDLTFSSYCKYRKTIYDYVYKSQRNAIDGHIFDEMVFNSIKDDIKNKNDYGIKEKLNIWHSLYGYFNKNNNNQINMVNKLKEYQNFVASIIADGEFPSISDEKFAFAAGQVIEYILSKSKSANTSYSLLEPYLQQSKCAEFKRAIANDFGRYKHENFSKNFEKVAAFVLSYETSANLKHLLPQILSGVFSKNQLFSNNSLK
ncbi:MAG: hypothetical protein LBJ72_09295 [Dysgonamonadaceae bacterium]|jgi:CRISPR-associated protein Csh1|nr:hypothetical protein [Dysgonamonadaceae bacterium]